MFERYTERARRVLFFARYETSQRGGLTITAEHLLLGVVREGKGIAHQILRDAGVSYDELVRELESRFPARERVASSVEIPFSPEARDILQLTAAEADSLGHGYIGAEHLLLGVLRHGDTVAAAILRRYGLELEGTRSEVARLVSAVPPETDAENPKPAPTFEARDVLVHVNSIASMVDQLKRGPGDPRFVEMLYKAIENNIDALRKMLT